MLGLGSNLDRNARANFLVRISRPDMYRSVNCLTPRDWRTPVRMMADASILPASSGTLIYEKE